MRLTLFQDVGRSSAGSRLSTGRVLVKYLSREEITRDLARIPEGHHAILQVKRRDDKRDLTQIVIAKVRVAGHNTSKGITIFEFIEPLSRDRATRALDLFTEQQSRETRFSVDAIRATIRDPERPNDYRLLKGVTQIKSGPRPEHYLVFSIVSCPLECIPV